jgi:succinate dehydrogenase hydrophobic anchor subunit
VDGFDEVVAESSGWVCSGAFEVCSCYEVVVVVLAAVDFFYVVAAWASPDVDVGCLFLVVIYAVHGFLGVARVVSRCI